MSLMFWKAPKPKAVTQAVNRYLVSQYHVGPESMAKLWMLEKNGTFSTRKVKLVRVYDPAFLAADDTAKLRYDDLSGVGNKKALQFEGHIEMDGALFFSDRRPNTNG